MSISKIKNLLSILINSPLLKSSAKYLVFDGFSKFLLLLVIPITTTYLSPEEYGVMATYLMLVSIICILIPINTHSVLKINYFRMSQDEFKKSVRAVIQLSFLGTAITLIIILASLEYTTSWTGLNTTWLLLLPLLGLCVILVDIQSMLYQVEEKIRNYGVLLLCQALILAVLIFVLLVWFNWGLEGRFWSYFISVVTVAVFVFYMLRQHSYISISKNKKYIKDALEYGLPLYPHTFSLWLKAWADRFIVLYILGYEAFGIYSLAIQIGLIMKMLVNSVNTAFLPYLYRALNKSDIKADIKLVRVIYGTIAGFIVFSLLMGYLLKLIVVPAFVGDKFQDVIHMIIPICLGMSFHGCYLIVVKFFPYKKRMALLSKISVSLTAVNIVVVFISVNYFGIEGAVYALMLYHLINFIITWVIANKVYPMPWSRAL